VGKVTKKTNDQLLNEIDQLKTKVAELEKSQMGQKSLEKYTDISFEDLFNIKDIQQLQDEFSAATGVASIITDIEGVPITKASNFTNLCENIIRKTEKGIANCYKSDAVIGKLCIQGPTIQPCLSGGLWDAGAGISVEGKHLANWLIGQVRDETQTKDQMLKYAKEIGAEESAFLKAFYEVPSMSRKNFEQIAQVLFTLSNQLSEIAYQGIQKTKYIAEREIIENKLLITQADLRNTLNISPAIICTANAKTGYIIEANPAVNSILGYSLGEFTSKPFSEFIHPDDRLRTDNEVIEQLKGKAVAYFENRYLCKDGSYKWLAWQATGADKNGKIYAVGTDITDHKKADEELKQHRYHLEDLVKERTAEVEEKNKKLSDQMKIFVGRELRIRDLEKRIRMMEG